MVGLLSLKHLGWSEFFSDQINQQKEHMLQPARVIAIHKGACDVSDGTKVYSVKMSGRFRHQSESRTNYPTVGDWVLIESLNRVQRVLKRKTVLKRKKSGRTSNEQLIASNLDAVFVIQSVDRGINLNRIERYLVMINESNIKPILILTKIDLISEEYINEIKVKVQSRFPDIDLHMISNETLEGLDQVRNQLISRKTYCVIGLSGVGKSTLLNCLLKEARLFTMPVRESDGKGVHSTTWRELITLDEGAHIIDTPGMRELGNIESNVGLEETFSDIFELAKKCKYNNCSHRKEKGCAVISALDAGLISRSRYEHFIKLSDEAFFFNKGAIEKNEQIRKSKKFYRSLNNKKSK